MIELVRDSIKTIVLSKFDQVGLNSWHAECTCKH